MPSFQQEPLTELPRTLDIARQMLAVSYTHLSNLEAMNNNTACVDKTIIRALLKIFSDLKLVSRVFAQFCQNWKQEPLTKAQQNQIDDVEKSLLELERLHERIMFLLDYLGDSAKCHEMR